MTREEVEQGYHLGPEWRPGKMQLLCNYCPFDSFYENIIRDHVVCRHQERWIKDQLASTTTKPMDVLLYDANEKVIESREILDGESQHIN